MYYGGDALSLPYLFPETSAGFRGPPHDAVCRLFWCRLGGDGGPRRNADGDEGVGVVFGRHDAGDARPLVCLGVGSPSKCYGWVVGCHIGLARSGRRSGQSEGAGVHVQAACFRARSVRFRDSTAEIGHRWMFDAVGVGPVGHPGLLEPLGANHWVVLGSFRLGHAGLLNTVGVGRPVLVDGCVYRPALLDAPLGVGLREPGGKCCICSCDFGSRLVTSEFDAFSRQLLEVRH